MAAAPAIGGEVKSVGWGAYGIITSEAYFVKFTEFGLWAKSVKRLDVSTLKRDEARTLFNEYVELFNSGLLPAIEHYDATKLTPAAVTATATAIATATAPAPAPAVVATGSSGGISASVQSASDSGDVMSGESGSLWLFGYGSLIWKPNFPFVEKRVGWITGYKRRFWQGSTDHRGVPGAPGRVVTLIPVPSPESQAATNNNKSNAATATTATTATTAAAAAADSKSSHARSSALTLDGEDEPSANEYPAVTCGMCYLIAGDKRKEVLQYLDVREQGGYTQALVPVYWDKPTSQALTTTNASGSGGSSGGGGSIKALIYLATTENVEYLGPAPLTAVAQQIAFSKGPSGLNSEYLFNLATALRSLSLNDAHVFALEERVKTILSTAAAAVHTNDKSKPNGTSHPTLTTTTSNALNK